MVATAAIATPIPKPNKSAAFVDPETGNLSQHGAGLLGKWHGRHVGTSRLIPCEATGKNVVTLTPLAPAPSLEGYTAFDCFQFVAAQTSDGAMTATVVPEKGTLSTLKIYKTHGSAQAGAGDVTANLYYTLTYVDTLDTAAGGFVLT